MVKKVINDLTMKIVEMLKRQRKLLKEHFEREEQKLINRMGTLKISIKQNTSRNCWAIIFVFRLLFQVLD